MSDEQVAEVSTEEVAPSGTSENWRSMIPEEIRDHKSLATIQDVGSLAKGFVHAQSMIGADKIALPGKSSTADDWNAVYSKLGRPEDPSGYQINYTPPEGVQPDDGVVQWFMGVAHEAGLNNTQAQKSWTLADGSASWSDRTRHAKQSRPTRARAQARVGRGLRGPAGPGNAALELSVTQLSQRHPCRTARCWAITRPSSGSWQTSDHSSMKVSEDARRVKMTGRTDA